MAASSVPIPGVTVHVAALAVVKPANRQIKPFLLSVRISPDYTITRSLRAHVFYTEVVSLQPMPLNLCNNLRLMALWSAALV